MVLTNRNGDAVQNLAVQRAKEKYNELFSSEQSKAEAFDKIAEKYFLANFGTFSKSDMDLLMFSIYLEQILATTDNDMVAYSDYALSKSLGITQSRISNLKVKKELQYPSEKISWQEQFAEILNNYHYENGKIKLFVPDRPLYYELKNIVESAGGYIEVQLNTSLLQVSPEYFVDILVAMTEEKNRAEIKATLKKSLNAHKVSTAEFDKKPIGELLKLSAADISLDIVAELIGICIPGVGAHLRSGLKQIVKELKNNGEK